MIEPGEEKCAYKGTLASAESGNHGRTFEKLGLQDNRQHISRGSSTEPLPPTRVQSSNEAPKTMARKMVFSDLGEQFQRIAR